MSRGFLCSFDLFQMEEKHEAFRKSTTGVKAERRKKKQREEDEGEPTTTATSLEEAKQRNPKAFSIQNPVKAQQQIRR